MSITSTSSITAPSARQAPIDDRYDVVVVGARAAGASTAMLLARRGLSVLAVDRSAYGSDTLSTHSIAIPGVLQLSRWGVLDDIRAGGTPATRTIRFHYGSDDQWEFRIPARGDVDGVYSPRRTHLDATLVDHAVAAGADVRHGVSVRALTRDGSGRVDGVELDVDGTTRRVGARFVVGADGMRSRVASQVGAVTTYQEPTGAGDIYSYWEGVPTDTMENWYQPGRAAGIIPTDDGQALVWVGMSPEMFHEVARGQLEASYHALIGTFPELVERLRHGRRVAGYRGFPGTPGFLRHPFGPGWALVGDAGYFKDPVSAHGITDAFISAELLADALHSVLRCGEDELGALSRYRDVRDSLAGEMMPPTVTVAGLPDDMRVVRQAFVDIAAAMTNEFALIVGLDAVPSAA